MNDHDSPRRTAAAGAEHAPVLIQGTPVDPLQPVRALKRRVQAAVFAAILLCEPFYVFALDLSLTELLSGLLIGTAIATGAIEGAFYQIFKLRKRAAYPGEIALEVGMAGDVVSACRRALDVVCRRLDARGGFIAFPDGAGLPSVRASAGLTHEEAAALLTAKGRESWAAMATQGPIQCGEPEPPVRGIAAGSRLVFAPVVAVNRTMGVLGLIGERRNADLRESELLKNVGLGLGLALENIRQKQELREKESRLRTVVTGAPIGLYAVDKNGIFTLASGSALAVLGVVAEEFLGHSVFEKYADRPDVQENFRRALAGETVTSSVELAGITFESILSPEIDDEGNVTGVIGVAWDVTKRKKAEAALRESEVLLRSVVSNVPVVLFAVDQEGVFTLSEGKGLEALGLRPGQVTGLSVYDIYAEVPEILDNIRRALAGESFTSVVDAEGFAWETWYAPIRGAEGTVAGVIGVGANVTERKQTEDALRASEERYRSVVTALEEGIIIQDAAGVVQGCNASAERILGASSKSIEGRSLFESEVRVVREDGSTFAVEDYPAVQTLRTGQPQSNVVMGIERRPGELVWVSVNCQPLMREGTEAPCAVVTSMTDITERKRAGDALRENEEIYRTLVETSPDAVLLMEPDGTIIKANRTNVELLGLADAADAVGLNAMDFITEDDRERVREQVRENGVTALKNIEYTLVRVDGRRVPIELNVSAVRDAEGNAKAFISVARDITERKHAEEALRQSEERFRELFDNATDIVYTHDLAGKFLSINRAAERITGYTAEEALGTSIARIVAPEHLQMAAEMIRRKASDGGQTTYELEIIAKDGHRVPLEVSTRIVYQDGKPVAVQGIAREITERRRSQEALRRREAILEAVSFAASRFLMGAVDDADDIREVLDRLGTAAEVSRAYIFEITRRPENDAVIRIRQEWVAPGVSAQIDNPELSGFSMRAAGFGRWIGPMSGGEAVHARVRDMSAPERAALEAQDILSLACAPIFVGGEWWGFIGFDECATEREWTAVEVDALKTAADLLGAAIQRQRGEEALRESEEKYRELVENTNEVIYTLDSSGIVTYVSPVVEQVGGFAPSELVGQSFVPLIHPEDMPALVESFQRTLGGQLEPSEYRMKTKSGDYRWVRSSSRPIHEDGRVVGLRGLLVDITERRRAEQALRESEERYRNVVETARDVIYTLGADGTLTSLNPAFESVTGWPCQDWTGKSFVPLIHPDDLNHAMDTFRRVLAGETVSYELQILRKGGGYLVGEFTSTPLIEDGRVVGALGFARDITERKKAEKMIRQLAYHDALTGLPNRALFEDRLRVALAQAHRGRQMVAVMFLDLDRFKVVNDTLGHGDGDKLLKEVARDLSELVREGDTVARVGGDEFTLLLSAIHQPEDATEIAERILERLKQPRQLGGHEFRVTTSIGITVYPDDGADPETLLRNADTAMYRAKEQGRDNYQCYTPAMNVNIMERLALERDLRRALERDEFALHYQPLADVATGRVTGAEALLRWQRPGRGLVSPDDFIPVAEETGMIVPLGEWVLRTACRQNRAWLDAGYPPVRMAVNLSARQLQDERLATVVADVLEETGLAPEYLQLEITESAVMTNVEAIIGVLHDLRAMGIGISVDDFGTGYSSLSYLKRFPVDNVKIDRSFVRDLATDPNDAAIVTTIIAMARSLNLKVIAEGVETEEQLRFLKRRSCDEFQGFFLSRALPPAGFEKVLGKATQPREKIVRLKSA